MAKEGFKRIAVTAAESDDDVIVVGVPLAKGDDEKAAPSPLSTAPAETPGPSPVPMPSARAEKPLVDRAPGPKERSAGSKESEDGFKGTTLEDLSATPLSKTQLIVIVAAVVLLIVGAVYYFAVMR